MLPSLIDPGEPSQHGRLTILSNPYPDKGMVKITIWAQTPVPTLSWYQVTPHYLRCSSTATEQLGLPARTRQHLPAVPAWCVAFDWTALRLQHSPSKLHKTQPARQCHHKSSVSYGYHPSPKGQRYLLDTRGGFLNTSGNTWPQQTQFFWRPTNVPQANNRIEPSNKNMDQHVSLRPGMSQFQGRQCWYLEGTDSPSSLTWRIISLKRLLTMMIVNPRFAGLSHLHKRLLLITTNHTRRVGWSSPHTPHPKGPGVAPRTEPPSSAAEAAAPLATRNHFPLRKSWRLEREQPPILRIN